MEPLREASSFLFVGVVGSSLRVTWLRHARTITDATASVMVRRAVSCNACVLLCTLVRVGRQGSPMMRLFTFPLRNWSFISLTAHYNQQHKVTHYNHLEHLGGCCCVPSAAGCCVLCTAAFFMRSTAACCVLSTAACCVRSTAACCAQNCCLLCAQ